MPFLLVTVSTVKLLPGVLDSSDGAEARLKIPNHLASPSLRLDDSSRVTGYPELEDSNFRVADHTDNVKNLFATGV